MENIPHRNKNLGDRNFWQGKKSKRFNLNVHFCNRKFLSASIFHHFQLLTSAICLWNMTWVQWREGKALQSSIRSFVTKFCTFRRGRKYISIHILRKVLVPDIIYCRNSTNMCRRHVSDYIFKNKHFFSWIGLQRIS